MRCAIPEQRRCSRVHLPIQSAVVFQELGTDPRLAFLRDLSMLGAFCYCSLSPTVGHHARLILELSENGQQMRASCEGIVVRVEKSAPGAATGVAIEFTGYGITRASQTKEPRKRQNDAPFINWTVEMVERIFAKSISQCVSPECEQAA